MTAPRQPHESGTWLQDLSTDIASRMREVEPSQAESQAETRPGWSSSGQREELVGKEISAGEGSSRSDEVWRLAQPGPGNLLSTPKPASNDGLGDTVRTAARGVLLGDYELLEEIAQGSVGIVYKARQVSLGRIVAVKVIPAGRLASAEAIRRFYSEAEAAASLHHPHIVPIYEVGCFQGLHFFSMRYVPGGSLAEHIGRLQGQWQALARLVATIARAVHYAHRHGVLHRDLKPANILLDADGQPAISDFGLCKRLTQAEEGPDGLLVGTPLYMAPEQIDNRFGNVTVASDVYSLGAILYELLTGQPPIGGESVADVLFRVVQENPKKVSQVRPGVPRDLEAICHKCLSKNPQARYQTAEELAEDLERYLKGEPIGARRVGALARWWRWCRRNPGTAIVTMAAMVIGSCAVLAILVTAVLVAWRETENVQRLEQWHQQAVLAKDEAAKQRQHTLAILRDTDLQRRQAQRQAAQLAWLQAAWVCDQGEPAEGLLWLTRTLNLLADAEPTDRLAVRTMLSSWQGWLNRLAFYARLPEPWLQVAIHPTEASVLGVSTRGQLFRWDWHQQAHPQRICSSLVGVRDAHFLLQGGALLLITRDGWQIWDASGQRLLEQWHNEAPLRSWTVAANGEMWAVSDHNGRVVLWARESTGASGKPARLLGRWRLALPADALAIAAQTQTVVARTSKGSWLLQDSQQGGTSQTPNLAFAPACLTISEDGTRLIFGVSECLVRIRDMVRQRTLLPALPLPSMPKTVYASRDGAVVVALGVDGVVHCWDARHSAPLGQSLGREAPITDCDLTPDARYLATICQDGALRIWETCPPVYARAQGQLGQAVEQACFSASGNRLASATAGQVKVYARNPSQVWESLAELDHPASVTQLAFNREGNRLLVATKDGRITLWNLGTEAKRWLTCEYGERLSLASWDQAGRYLASVGSDRQVVLWDLETKYQLGSRWTLGGLPTALTWEANGNFWAVGLDNGVVCVGTPTRPQQPPWCWPAHAGAVTALQFAEQGQVLISAGTDGKVLAWHTDKARLMTALSGHNGPVNVLATVPNRSLIFSGAKDYSGALHDWQQKRSWFVTRTMRQDWQGAWFSPSGTWLATVSGRPGLEFWHASTGYRLTPPLPLSAAVCAGVWLDNDEFCVVCQDGQLLSWRIPQPLLGDPDSLMAQWQYLTGLHLVGQTPRPIPPEQWQQLRWQAQQR